MRGSCGRVPDGAARVTISPVLQLSIPRPAIREDVAPLFDVLMDEVHQTSGGAVRDHLDPRSPHGLSLKLHGYRHFRLARLRSLRSSFGRSPDPRFVNFHAPRELLATRSHHRTSQLMQPRPRGLITSETHQALQSFGAPAGLLGHHPPHGLEPHRQGFARLVENRPCRQGMLPPTVCANQDQAAVDPVPWRRTGLAGEPPGPATPNEELPAGILATT